MVLSAGLHAFAFALLLACACALFVQGGDRRHDTLVFERGKSAVRKLKKLSWKQAALRSTIQRGSRKFSLVPPTTWDTSCNVMKDEDDMKNWDVSIFRRAANGVMKRTTYHPVIGVRGVASELPGCCRHRRPAIQVQSYFGSSCSCSVFALFYGPSLTMTRSHLYSGYARITALRKQVTTSP